MALPLRQQSYSEKVTQLIERKSESLCQYYREVLSNLKNRPFNMAPQSQASIQRIWEESTNNKISLVADLRRHALNLIQEFLSSQPNFDDNNIDDLCARLSESEEMKAIEQSNEDFYKKINTVMVDIKKEILNLNHQPLTHRPLPNRSNRYAYLGENSATNWDAINNLRRNAPSPEPCKNKSNPAPITTRPPINHQSSIHSESSKPTPTKPPIVEPQTPSSPEKKDVRQILQLGISYLNHNQWEEAHFSFKQAYELKPNSRLAEFIIRAYFKKNELTTSKDIGYWIKKLEDMEPKHAKLKDYQKQWEDMLDPTNVYHVEHD